MLNNRHIPEQLFDNYINMFGLSLVYIQSITKQCRQASTIFSTVTILCVLNAYNIIRYVR